MNANTIEPGEFYHLFNQGNNKEILFKEPKNYFYFLEKLAKYIPEIAEVYAYCLMSNHFHLLIRVKDLDELPGEYKLGKKKIHQPFSNLFNSYTKTINKAYGRTGSLFRERFHKHVIENEKQLTNVILYIHTNPEKHGYNVSFDKYKYSSYQSLLSDLTTLLKREEVIDLFESKENFIFCHKNKKMRIEEAIEEQISDI